MADLEPIRHFLVVFGLSIVRITAACSVVPFLSTTLIQGPVRRSLMICWGIMIYPIVAPTIELPNYSTLEILAVITKEIVLGILVGYLAAKTFWIAMSVGFFIDNQRGAAMASSLDPMSGEQTSPLGMFLQQVVIVLFYSSGGLLVFLGGIFQSYLLWPVDSFYPTLGPAFPGFFLEVTDAMMRLVVVFAAPVIITVFVTEFGLGLMNRFAPQLNVFVLAMPVKSLVGLIVLIVYLPFLLGLFESEFANGETMWKFLDGVLQ